jgi:hypothetical protein
MGEPKWPNTIHDGMGKVGCNNDMYEGILPNGI